MMRRLLYLVMALGGAGVALMALLGRGIRRLGPGESQVEGTYERPVDVFRRRQREQRAAEVAALRRSEEAGHEERDASVRVIIYVGIGFVLVALLLHVTLAWFFRYMAGGTGAETTDISKISAPEHGLAVRITPDTLPPYPRLMVNEPGDLRSVQQGWRKQLHSYGWVDRKAGVVHIPIDRAMDIIANQGPRPETTPTQETQFPTGWNNGGP